MGDEVFIRTVSGRSSPRPNPGFPVLSPCAIMVLRLLCCETISFSSGRLLSDKLANIDPKASSTSGKEASESVDVEFGMDVSESELGIEAWDKSDGSEGNDSNGGEWGGDCVVSSYPREYKAVSASPSVSGSWANGENGEKSRLISILGEPALPEYAEEEEAAAAAGMTGGSRGISSISSILTDCSSALRLDDGAQACVVNPSESCCGVAGMIFSMGTRVSGKAAILSLLANNELWRGRRVAISPSPSSSSSGKGLAKLVDVRACSDVGR